MTFYCLVTEVEGGSVDTLGEDVASFSDLGQRFVASTFRELALRTFAQQLIDPLEISCLSRGSFGSYQSLNQ